MKKFILTGLILLACIYGRAQFSVNANHHYILKDGKPFFWLGDTAWELFHRLNREEADLYLKTRSEQGFTVIQAVVLAELDGLHDPNAYGEKPLIDDDPTKPNEKYFEHVDYIVNKAAEYNLNIAMLPTWADKINKSTWGKGPEIFNVKNAAVYGKWLAGRYKDKTNIIWILGGDRQPRGEGDIAIWHVMGNAIMEATGSKAIITYHCQPNQLGSAQWFRNEKWFAFNMFQNGHCRDEAIFDKMSAAYSAQPLKPIIDGEPIYEDHPVCSNVYDLGSSSAYDVRKYAYVDVFSGAFGHTYGCHDIWQMYSTKHEPLNGPHIYWTEALKLPGARQMAYLRKLIESHPLLDRVPDQSLIKENNYPMPERVQATRGKDYAFIYTAAGKSFVVNMIELKADKVHAYWFDPRNGKSTDIGIFAGTSSHKFDPPSIGYGHDWVLVIDDEAKGYRML